MAGITGTLTRSHIGRCTIVCTCAALLGGMLLGGCAAREKKQEIQIPPETRSAQAHRPQIPELKLPEPAPVIEEISPLKTRIVDVIARNTPLRDVLHVIADATGLNLIMEREVNPDFPVTMTLRNVTAKDALDTIFASVDYFYAIENNMMFIRATDSRVYELGFPAIVQNYSVDVGGDILSGASGNNTGGTSTGSSSSTSGGSTSSGTNNLRGNVSQNTKSDQTAFNFWDTIEKSLAGILKPAAAPGPASASGTVQESFTLNRLTGTIVVNASKRNLKRVEQYLNAVRKVINRQVLVEAKIVEVSLSDNFQFGIDWALVGYKAGVGTYGASNLVMNTMTGVNYNPGTRTLSGIQSGPNPAPQQGFAKPGFNLGVTGSNFAAIVTALQEQGDVRTLSNPRVSIMNGQTALLSVGRNTNYIAKVETSINSSTANNLVTYTVTQGNVLSGIIIGLIPFVNENGEISLTITPIVSNLVSLEDKTFGINQTSISLPTVDLRELSTTVKVRDGQTIVIGGLIDQREQVVDDKVPMLGDIPLLGELFTKRTKMNRKSELVVILQPMLLAR